MLKRTLALPVGAFSILLISAVICPLTGVNLTALLIRLIITSLILIESPKR